MWEGGGRGGEEDERGETGETGRKSRMEKKKSGGRLRYGEKTMHCCKQMAGNYVQFAIYTGAVASLSTIARPFLVFVAVFEVLEPHPRGPYIDRRVIVSAQRPERRCSKG